MILLACDTSVALIFYHLFIPVNQRLSIIAAFFRLVLVAIMAVNSLNYFGLLDPLPGAHSARAFNTGYSIGLVPFGVHCLLVGYLIFKSTFLPRFLGVLMALAGSAYLICVWPPLANRIFFPYIAIPGVLGEGALTLWLIVIGVNAQQWTEQSITKEAAHQSVR